jgi:NADH-quinone oxidoreductase subunit N
VTAYFTSAPKLAAMALIVRVVIDAFHPITSDWRQIVTFIAIASMLLGSFAAIGQSNIKRLMAYSSIAHMGFALVGLAAGTEQGVQGVIIYIVIYIAMTLGAFAAILAMRRNGVMTEEIESLAGLARTKPATAFLFGAILFALAGIPPLAGFFAKYYVFLAAVQSGLYGLAVIGVLASVVGAYYYLRIVKVMYFDAPAEGEFEPVPVELGAVLGLCGAFMIVFVVVAGPLVDAAGAAAHSLF